MEEETTGFLEALFAPYRGAGWVEVRCLTAALGTTERSVPRRWFPLTEFGLKTASAWATRQAHDWNVYYGVLPRDRAGQGGADAVAGAAWLWCDIDNAPTWKDANGLLQHAALPAPHLAVGSGNGCHVYWRLAAVEALPDADSRRQFRSLLRRLCGAIGGAPDAAHADLASTDAARILRLPGTRNWKDTANPKPVRIVHACPHAPVLSAAQWNGLLPAEKAVVTRQNEKGAARYSPRVRVHPLLRDVSPVGCRHDNAIRLLMCLHQRGADTFALEDAARAFCALNAFPADEMDGILRWVRR